MAESDENVHHRPPEYGERMSRYQVHLPKHLYEYAKSVGNGTLAAGVRECIEKHMERDD